MKKLIYLPLFLHYLVVFCSPTNSNAMCSSSSISSSPSSATSTVSLNPTSSNKCKLRAAARQELVQKIIQLMQEVNESVALKTIPYLEFNNSTKAPPEAEACFATANSNKTYVIHLYPRRYAACSLLVQKFLLGRLFMQIRNYPETLTTPLIDRSKVAQIVAHGITQSLTTLPDKANDVAYQQLDQISLIECPCENVLRIVSTAFLKGIAQAVQSYIQEKLNDKKKLTLKLDAQSAQISDDHHKGAIEYLEHRAKQEKTWGKAYLWLQQYIFGYATATERLRELPEYHVAQTKEQSQNKTA